MILIIYTNICIKFNANKLINFTLQKKKNIYIYIYNDNN